MAMPYRLLPLGPVLSLPAGALLAPLFLVGLQRATSPCSRAAWLEDIGGQFLSNPRPTSGLRGWP
eukprot:8275277-Pyramimonas_sp.AAC.1